MKNASNVLHSHYDGEFENTIITGQFGFVFERLGQANHVIIVRPSCSKSCGFKPFSVHAETKSRRFQVHVPLRVQNFSRVVWTLALWLCSCITAKSSTKSSFLFFIIFLRPAFQRKKKKSNDYLVIQGTHDR